jgi:hypothetical protein
MAELDAWGFAQPGAVAPLDIPAFRSRDFTPIRLRRARVGRAILSSQSEEVGRISPPRRRGENRPQLDQFGSSLVAGPCLLYFCLSWKLLIRKEFWLRGKDLNLRPLGIQSEINDLFASDGHFPDPAKSCRTSITLVLVGPVMTTSPRDWK